MTLAQELDSYIRSGRFDEVERLLQKVGKVERADAVPIANIARRVGRLNLAAKIMNPIVRPTDNLQEPATALEKIEYADTLRLLGAINEAWKLLSEIDLNDCPQASAHMAYCLMSQWRYEEALTIMQDYVRSDKITPYQKTVGQINLSSILIQVGKLDEARSLLAQLREHTQSSGLNLLYGNSLELTAQTLIFQKDFDSALEVLEESADVLKKAGKVVSLFVQKWTAIAMSLKENRVTQELRDVFSSAQTASHWETVRDCDLYIGVLDRDQNRLTRLYFGTPYESFRKHIFRTAGGAFEIPEEYLWCPSGSSRVVLNLTTAQVTGAITAQLPPGQALHRLLILLCQDFYKPLSVMSAFGKLFPDEYMNAITSPNRVHQIVKRCREWIEQTGLPLQIKGDDGFYKLAVGDNLGIVVPAQPLPSVKEEIEFFILEKSLDSKPFTADQAAEVLQCSKSSARILLSWALGKGRLKKQGSGPRISYLFQSTKTS